MQASVCFASRWISTGLFFLLDCPIPTFHCRTTEIVCLLVECLGVSKSGKRIWENIPAGIKSSWELTEAELHVGSYSGGTGRQREAGGSLLPLLPFRESFPEATTPSCVTHHTTPCHATPHYDTYWSDWRVTQAESMGTMLRKFVMKGEKKIPQKSQHICLSNTDTHTQPLALREDDFTAFPVCGSGGGGVVMSWPPKMTSWTSSPISD